MTPDTSWISLMGQTGRDEEERSLWDKVVELSIKEGETTEAAIVAANLVIDARRKTFPLDT